MPKHGGIYALYDSAGGLLYVGQATNLRVEVRQTLNRAVNFPVRMGPNLSKKRHPKFKSVTHRLSIYVVPSKRLRHNLEALLLRVFANESHNNKLGTFR
jgi:excinuclease UvrABC nuclease subunit